MREYCIPDGLFCGAEVVANGTLTNRILGSNLVRRVVRGVYVSAATPVTHAVKCEAASMVVPAKAVLTGRSAAAVRGLDLTGPDDPVEFVVRDEDRFGPVKGMNIRRTRMSDTEYEPWRGIRIASDERMILDILLRHAPRTRPLARRIRATVADADAMLHEGLVGPAQLARAVRGRNDHGIVLARNVLELVDGRAESRPESEVRVVLTLAGMAPAVQWHVQDSSGRTRRLDLCYPERMVAVEYDGKWHAGDRQVVADQRRRAELSAEGWTFVILTAEDLWGPSEGIVAKVRDALSGK